MQVFVGVGRITRDREAKRAIKQSDNMCCFLAQEAKTRKRTRPNSSHFFRKNLF